MGRMRERPKCKNDDYKPYILRRQKKFQILTEAPTTRIRVEDFITKKHAEYPEDPARKVCNGAQGPVMTRAGNSTCARIWRICDSTDKLGFSKATSEWACVRERGWETGRVGCAFSGRVAQEFGVQVGRVELWRCRDGGTQAGIRCLGRRKQGQRACSDHRRFRRTGPYTEAKESEGEG